MLARLLLLFILVPIVELLLLLTLADLTGFWITVGLIVVTGVLGASLARHQGLRCWREVQQRMARGEVPADSLQDGLMILIAGAVLITPGVLTDLLGFALLMPPIRRFLKGYLAKRMKVRIVMMSPTARREEPSEKEDKDVIDVDYRETDYPE